MKSYQIILFLLYTNLCFCQNIYFSGNNNWIYKINVDNTISSVIEVSTGLLLNDIALSPNNEFYGVNSNKIYRINIDGSMVEKAVLPQGSYNNLVCSNNNELYTISNIDYKLYKYNITNNVLEMIASIGLDTPGDLTFYRGNLIFPVLENTTKKIVAYNLQTQTLSTIFCLGSTFGSQLFGITNIHNTCESESIYLTSSDQLFQLDFEQNTLINLGINLLGVSSGLTSTTEFLSSDCSFQFPNISCTLRNDDFELESSGIFLSPNPVENNIVIKSMGFINSVEFYSMQGKLLKKINNPDIHISLDDFTAGIYLARFYIDEKIITKKIIKN